MILCFDNNSSMVSNISYLALDMKPQVFKKTYFTSWS